MENLSNVTFDIKHKTFEIMTPIIQRSVPKTGRSMKAMWLILCRNLFKTWRAFIFLQIKKINAKKRFWKKAMEFRLRLTGCAVTSWGGEKERSSQRSFSPPQLPTHMGNRALSKYKTFQRALEQWEKYFSVDFSFFACLFCITLATIERTNSLIWYNALKLFFNYRGAYCEQSLS